MKAVRITIHLLLTLLVTFLLVAVPALILFDPFGTGKDDAMTSASVKLPDKPSGEYLVLLNRSLHEETLEEWEAFFRDGELEVIFDDINCLAADSDIPALKMADRFLAQLPENQMHLKTENATLLVSKAENGCIDAAVFSREMADSLKLSVSQKDILVISVKGGEENGETH